MMSVTEADICEHYERMLRAATQLLCELPIFCGRAPTFSRLSGWVFEQTVQKCIRDSLAEEGVDLPCEEQVSLGGRAKADLKIGATAIELKTAGLFGDREIAKYVEHQSRARARGMRFMLLSRYESHKPYRSGIINASGADCVFFLDEPGSWRRFITTLFATVKTEGPENRTPRSSENETQSISGQLTCS